uniref:Uncharacterized protein n=1 Tax=viral metagenome TaxID=1070528 RepID=A0A6C0J3S8_9ZZZZ
MVAQKKEIILDKWMDWEVSKGTIKTIINKLDKSWKE